jgi:hypothetical protein
MIEDFCRVLREKLQEQAQTEIRSLSRGSAKDFGSYQYSCGVIRGLELAENELRELLSAAREAYDL